MNDFWQAPPTLTHVVWQTAQTACQNAMLAGAAGIDWSACKQLDSSALALAIAAQRTSKLSLQHLHTPPQLLQLAQLHGVDRLLGLS